LECGI